jgi:carbonic anhydrase
LGDTGPAALLYDAPVEESAFADILAANARFAASYDLQGLEGHAAKGLAILTCMDSRIEPLAALGLRAGDAKILRNAGARVTDDVLRTVVLARYLLGVERLMIMQHTDCRMAVESEEELHHMIERSGGPDTRELDFLVDPDQPGAIRADVARVRASTYLTDLEVGGFIYDLATGRLAQVA